MATIKNNAKATLKGKTKISRMWVIRKLCQKAFGATRPTAVQINAVIK